MVSYLEEPGALCEEARSQFMIRWNVALPTFEDFRSMRGWLRRNRIEFKEGRRSLYLPPQQGLSNILRAPVDFYPSNAGYKILKDFSPTEQSSNLSKDAIAVARPKPAGSQHGLLAVANYMYSKGLGPRVWDVCAWDSPGATYTVFVVDHIAGNSPEYSECNKYLNNLTRIVTDSQLRILLPHWEKDPEFQPPNCSNNLIQCHKLGYPQYIDFHNFTLASSEAWTNEVIANGEHLFHFGGTRSFRPTTYLYQSIPGMDRPGKRNSLKRWKLITDALQDTGIELEGRIVLDIGCNAGIMLYLSLAHGAYWGFGWDLTSITEYTQDLLHSLGMSRFQLKGAVLSPSYDIIDDIPCHLLKHCEESIVFYLSVYLHMGLLNSINRIPWRIFIFEGHQGETIEEIDRLLSTFLEYDVTPLCREYMEDGDSGRRPIIMLARK
jgi:hypothetical protein